MRLSAAATAPPVASAARRAAAAAAAWQRPAAAAARARGPVAAARGDAGVDSTLAELLAQAAHAPVVSLPLLGAGSAGDDGAAAVRDAAAPRGAPEGVAMPSRRLRPSRMAFDAMLARLAAWRAAHLSAHVPRHCFDAPELGAWVRAQRKAHRDGALEAWKVERLNELGFEWEVSDQDAKWHHTYHQLRRYRLLHGSTAVDPRHGRADATDWRVVARWLDRQARLLAKRKLSEQRRAMLAQLGVTLRVPRRLLARTAALQGLNGTERRQLRKRWRAADRAAAAAARDAAAADAEADAARARQAAEVVARRAALLQAAREAAGPAQQEVQLAQQAPAPAQPQQPPERQPEVPPEAPLFFQRNRRSSRRVRQTRQEAWLAAQREGL
ncbi:hypothetical protein HT031_002244 [Scenedesmus sp. PABB004]|nr:hypothetical protein HT031_002244 [Scenedesmus sp. PABB004]